MAGVTVQRAAGAPQAASETSDHRERLIAAMAESITEKGYRDTTVADVVRIARTSRRNFYEHFADREACFLALFDATNDAMMQQIADAVHPDQPLEQQVRGIFLTHGQNEHYVLAAAVVPQPAAQSTDMFEGIGE